MPVFRGIAGIEDCKFTNDALGSTAARQGNCATSCLRRRRGGDLVSFEDFVERSQRARTVPQLRAVFERAISEEGFENQFVGTMTGRVATNTGWVRFPTGHFEAYLAERWNEIDPILTHLLGTSRPFYWNDVAKGLRFSRAQRALLDECKRVGVHSLIIVPFQSGNGSCDVVSISQRHREPPDRHRIPILQAMCAQLWCRYSDIDGNKPSRSHTPVLTKRELDILKWVKDGKSNPEIAEITSLSVKTIEYHIGNVLKKLGATNRTTAVVIAIQKRLLAL
jgi:LuxR family transcriptional regulator, quorum-sensing system regulator SolR